MNGRYKTSNIGGGFVLGSHISWLLSRAFRIIHICIFKPEICLPEIESALFVRVSGFQHIIIKITQNYICDDHSKFVVNCHFSPPAR